jgi:gamma-glutamylcyclotransferase (GGCT)/AIG2-like uncharacterized protein YtfP
MNLVAVYGSLRKGMGNHSVMIAARGEYLGTHTIEGFALHEYCKAFPCVTERSGHTTVVEVYEVDADGLQILDSLEGYEDGTSREESWFYYRATTSIPALGQVFIYIMPRYNEDNIITHGDWVKHKSR